MTMIMVDPEDMGEGIIASIRRIVGDDKSGKIETRTTSPRS